MTIRETFQAIPPQASDRTPEWAAAQAAAAAAAGLTLTPPNANELVLDLLATHDAHSLPLRPLLRAGGLFGFSDQTIRVALSRLKRDGRVVTTARGVYALPPGGSLLMREVEGWGAKEARAVAWTGAWIAVAVGGLDRTDRPLLRRHERALRLRGFQGFAPGLHLRPDNLAGGTGAVRSDLMALGLAPTALVCRLDQLSADDERRARDLWDLPCLAAGYHALLDLVASGDAALDASDAGQLAAEQAAAQALTLGRVVIRSLIRDPLLPDAMLPAADRRRLVAAVAAYQRRAKHLWTGLLTAWAAG
jgi:phenylacetic acid degradation operon negative regulatory protein